MVAIGYPPGSGRVERDLRSRSFSPSIWWPTLQESFTLRVLPVVAAILLLNVSSRCLITAAAVLLRGISGTASQRVVSARAFVDVVSCSPVRTEIVALASAGMTVEMDDPETLMRWILRLGSRQLQYRP